MYLIPDYMENIIVGILFENHFTWYVTERELWYLDYIKVETAYQKKGIEVNREYIDDRRKDFIILDTNNAAEFLNLILINKVISEELKYNLLANKTELDDTWKYDYRPSLYVNFDEKIFYSLYSEPASFEFFVPNLWVGKYDSFDDFIPKDQKYWLGLSNKNFLY